MRKGLAKALDYLVDEAHEKLTDAFAPDTCILQTRLAAGALRAHGVKCEPVTCTLLAANALWWDRHDAGEHPLSDPEAWAVGVGAQPQDDSQTPEEYEQTEVGHVVLCGSDWLLDMTADQASRPARSMPVEALWSAADRQQVKDFKAQQIALSTVGGPTRIEYRAMPHRKATLMKSPDWRLKGKKQGPWMDGFVRGLEEELSERVGRILR